MLFAFVLLHSLGLLVHAAGTSRYDFEGSSTNKNLVHNQCKVHVILPVEGDEYYYGRTIVEWNVSTHRLFSRIDETSIDHRFKIYLLTESSPEKYQKIQTYSSQLMSRS